jgi:prolyl oligopeptidase
LPLDTPELRDAVEIVPTGEAVIGQIVPTADALYVGDVLGGPSQIRRFGLDGKGEAIIPVPKISAVQEMLALEDNSLLFRDVSYIEPAAWFHCVQGKTEPVKTALRSTSPVSFADIEVTREFATSKDGAKIPLNIVFRKGMKRDGQNPTLLYGYGGYGISMAPNFDFTRRLWFDRGGVYVVANIRGGGEFGEEWHKAGNLTKKQNVFDFSGRVYFALIRYSAAAAKSSNTFCFLVRLPVLCHSSPNSPPPRMFATTYTPPRSNQSRRVKSKLGAMLMP